MKTLLRTSALAVVFAATGTLVAQQDMTAEWKISLADLDRRFSSLSANTGPTAETWRTDVETLRSSLESFAASHSDIPLHLPVALAEKPSLDALRKQLDQLRAAVDEVIRRTPGSPFNLGRIEVTVSANITAPSPVADSIDQSEIRNLNFTNTAKALDYLPGVSIQHIATNRNEAGIMVRGFTTRGQVPLYLDGIPISGKHFQPPISVLWRLSGRVQPHTWESKMSSTGTITTMRDFPKAGRTWFLNFRYSF